MFSSNFSPILGTYNYLFIFFNYELLVVVCFFFFLIFALLSEKGQLANYFRDSSLAQRALFAKFLSRRQALARDLVSAFEEKSILEMGKLAQSYENASYDLLGNFHYLTKKLASSLAITQVRNYLETITLRTQYISLQIKLFLTHDLFGNPT